MSDGSASESANIASHSAMLKTETPSQDPYSHMVHSELEVKPDPQLCSIKQEADLGSGLQTQPDCLVKTEVVFDEDSISLDIKHQDFEFISINDRFEIKCEPKQEENIVSDRSPQVVNDNGQQPPLPDKLSANTVNCEKPYKCKVCLQTFSRKNNLNAHLHKHSGEKLYDCDVCAKTFFRGNDLRRHIRIHTGEKPYECNTCLKTFCGRSDLQRHTRVHTGEKPYECDVCKKTFSSAHGYKKHLKIHAGEKPYQCEICKKTFPVVSDLKMHSRRHTSERPYECKICNKRFLMSSGLKRHMLGVHTVEKP